MAVSLSPEDVSEMIGWIYDCALDPERWPETLDRLKRGLGFTHATLSLHAMPAGAVLLNVTSGIPSPWLERIPDYSADIFELWGGARALAAQPLEQPLLLSEINSTVADGSCQNPYYLEWRKPQGLIDTITVGLARDSATVAAASLVRHERDGPIGAEEIDLVRLFVPHLRRAVTVSRILDARSVAAATFAAVLDATSAPILLVDGAMRRVHANSAGEAMLEERKPLALVGGIVSGASEGVNRALAAAVSQLCVDESGLGRKGLGVPARDARGGPCALHVLSLRRGALRPGLAPEAAAAILVSAAHAPQANVGEAVRALFDLTQAESRVFDQIVAGRTVAETASGLGVTVRTVRTHLAEVFAKTGTRRQAELVRLAASLAPPLR